MKPAPRRCRSRSMRTGFASKVGPGVKTTVPSAAAGPTLAPGLNATSGQSGAMSGPASFRLLHVFEFAADGKIESERVWVDLAAIQEQLSSAERPRRPERGGEHQPQRWQRQAQPEGAALRPQG